MFFIMLWLKIKNNPWWYLKVNFTNLRFFKSTPRSAVKAVSPKGAKWNAGLRQSQAISNLTKIKNPNFKIQMPNEIQMSKCQNIKSVSSEIVREWNSQISFLSHSLLTSSLFTNFVIGILGLIWHLSFVICHFKISVKITLTKSWN